MTRQTGFPSIGVMMLWLMGTGVIALESSGNETVSVDGTVITTGQFVSTSASALPSPPLGNSYPAAASQNLTGPIPPDSKNDSMPISSSIVHQDVNHNVSDSTKTTIPTVKPKNPTDDSEVAFLNRVLSYTPGTNTKTENATPHSLEDSSSENSQSPQNQDVQLEKSSDSSPVPLSSEAQSAISDFYNENHTVFAYPAECVIPRCHLAVSTSANEQMIFYGGMRTGQFFILYNGKQRVGSESVLQCLGASNRCLVMAEQDGGKPMYRSSLEGTLTLLNERRSQYILKLSKNFFKTRDETEFVFRIPVIPHSSEQHQPEKPRVYYELKKFNSTNVEVPNITTGTHLASLWPSLEAEKRRAEENFNKHGSISMSQAIRGLPEKTESSESSESFLRK